MDFAELAYSRRSVRKYKNQALSREDLKKCVQSARSAPSACNSQPWKFIIIDDEKIKNNLVQKAFGMPPGINSFASECAAIIAIVSRSEKLPARLGEKIRRTSFRKIDIGLATSHLVLQAKELGIGSCILGWFNERKVKKILKVPRKEKVELLVSLGIPQSTALIEKSLRPIEEVLSCNGY